MRIVVLITIIFLFCSSMLFHMEALGVETRTKKQKQNWSINTCIAMVGDDPFGALAYAYEWQRQEHSYQAQRCQALALLYTGDEATAAKMLDELAQRAQNSFSSRTKGEILSYARIAAEAASAWLALGKVKKAQKIAAYGLSLVPNNQALLILQARALLLQGKMSQVVESLTPLLYQNQKDEQKDLKKSYTKSYRNLHGKISAQVFVILASAEQKMGHLNAALDYIQQAIYMNPQDSVALLERGIIREQRGDMTGAIQDWQRVLEVAPDSHEANMAQQDLDVMAADPDSPDLP
ncbi:MAG: tetratricopeptide repeat protein [Acetobacter sp.]|nr:tetratricopeptide repeat protein [Acetobacter sp.]